MSSLFAPVQSRGWFRGAILLFAFVLACQATWVLAAEWSRPVLPGFPANAQAAAAAAADRNAATLAASYGYIRGDLWAECALTYLNLIWSEDRPSPQDFKKIKQGREVAVRALTFAPYDTRIWLVLAGINLRADTIDHKMAAAALRMSYYTGANESEIIPLRLFLAVRSEALADTDFQRLIRHDIHIVVTRKPELKPAILSAYAAASSMGRHFIERTLKDIDPSLFWKLELKG